MHQSSKKPIYYFFRFWEQNQIASDGVTFIALNGATTTLESELKSKVIEHINCLTQFDFYFMY